MAPTEALTAEPTAAPTEAPTAEPTEEPWDESLCDHANENCEQAPACDVPDCWHIGLDDNYLEIPLCQKGLWLLNQQDRLEREGGGMAAMTRSVRSQVIDLNKADATIYRSGSYRVTGGNLRPGASLTVAENRLVVLELTEVTLNEVRLGDKAQATISAKKLNTVAMLTLGKGTKAELVGGTLTISQVQQPPKPEEGKEKEESKIFITGGSVKAELTEAEGREMHAFPAAGATAATVNGTDAGVDMPQEDGSVYLWLKAPEKGKKWAAAMNGTTLEVRQEADVPDETPQGIQQGQNNTLAGGSYELTGAVAEGTRLIIDQSGVTLMLTDVAFSGTLVEASCPYTLYAKGNTALKSDGYVLAGAGSPRIVADGRLSLEGGVEGGASYEGGAIVLSQIPAGYDAYVVEKALTNQTVTLDGQTIPLMMTQNGELLLPAPGVDKVYAIAADDQQVSIHTVDTAEKWFTLTGENPNAQAGSAAMFTVEGAGSYVTGQISAENAAANAVFRSVQVQNAGAALALSGEKLAVSLEGDNGLVSTDADAISLAGGSELTLNVASGRLLIRQQKDMNGLTLRGNIKIEPEPTLPHACVTIRDGSGNPVPNTALTVMIGGETYEFTTHFDGTLHLWGMNVQSGQALTATDGQQVYTGLIMNGTGDAITGLSIKDVRTEIQPDGTVKVLFACEGAATVGMQVYTGTAEQAMADTYLADANRYYGADGAVSLPPMTAGQVLSLRVFVSNAKGATLTPETADAFQFSDVYHVYSRVMWSTTESADAVYTGKAYKNPLKLPKNAQVSYSGESLTHDGYPAAVGDYVMHVTIPAGDQSYLPGTVDVPFKITRIPLTIVPAPNQEKYQGDMDPMFAFDVQGLLEGDELLGELMREDGEEVGNYAFIADGFSAEDYYTIRIASDAPTFTILPMMEIGGGGFFGVFEKLYPVRQEIVRGDKRTLAVVLNTQDSLTITHSVIGKVILSTEDDEPRFFSPSLSWNQETDEVLLRLRAEAELNKDGGYVTDVMGNPVWGGRYMKISWLGLRHMNQMGIDAISLSNSDAALTFRLEDFLTDEMEALVKEHKGTLKNVRYRFEVVPAQETGEAMDALHPITQGWRMAVSMIIDREETDITDQLPNLLATVDMEPTAAMLTGMELYEEEAFPLQYTLAVETQEGAAALETMFVQPYMPEEMEMVPYPCLMYTHRYLVGGLTQSSIVCAVDAPEQESPEEPAGEESQSTENK